MQRRLIPASAANDTLESYLAQTPQGSRPVYHAALATVVLVLIALPLLKVDVSVQAAGLVRPAIEKTEIKVPVSGRVAEVLVRPNDRVEAGATLARIDAPELAAQATEQRYQLRETNASIADLERLSSMSTREPDSASARALAAALRTPKYRLELSQMRLEVADPALRGQQAARELERLRQMHARGFASDSSIEQQRQQVDQLHATARLTVERSRARWQSELEQKKLERERLRSTLAQLDERQGLYAITSPLAGTIEELPSIARGSYVQAGDRFGVISPTAATVAEVLVSPANVGLLRVGMAVRLQVDAFRASEWGFLDARVASIADDFTIVNQLPVFRVQCMLARSTLRLPNGAVGHLKKGMTVRANFVVARRTLFQLLRDEASDWVDPRLSAVPGTPSSVRDVSIREGANRP